MGVLWTLEVGFKTYQICSNPKHSQNVCKMSIKVYQIPLMMRIVLEVLKLKECQKGSATLWHPT